MGIHPLHHLLRAMAEFPAHGRWVDLLCRGMAAEVMQGAGLSPEALALISGVSAILGAGVVALSTMITTWLIERARRRRHLTELAFQAAIEQYKSDKALMLEMAKRQPQETFRQYPLDDYIIGMSKLAQILASNPSDESLGRALDAMDRTLSVGRDHYKTMSESSLEEASRRVRRGQPP